MVLIFLLLFKIEALSLKIILEPIWGKALHFLFLEQQFFLLFPKKEKWAKISGTGQWGLAGIIALGFLKGQ